MKGKRANKPCRCGHPKTIHYAVHPKLKHYCRFPAASVEIMSRRRCSSPAYAANGLEGHNKLNGAAKLVAPLLFPLDPPQNTLLKPASLKSKGHVAHSGRVATVA
jgi:hypothetical protein